MDSPPFRAAKSRIPNGYKAGVPRNGNRENWARLRKKTQVALFPLFRRGEKANAQNAVSPDFVEESLE